MDDLVLKATVTKNNIKNHVFDIGDYPLSKDEADIIMKALEVYISYLIENFEKQKNETTI